MVSPNRPCHSPCIDVQGLVPLIILTALKLVLDQAMVLLGCPCQLLNLEVLLILLRDLHVRDGGRVFHFSRISVIATQGTIFSSLLSQFLAELWLSGYCLLRLLLLTI
jgi:hypothetical protein